MSVTIELDGVDIPVPPGTELAINYCAHDIRNISNRNGSYSPSFTLPDTNATRRILGNSQYVTSATIQPYRFIPTRIKSNGNPILTGRASHSQVNAGYALDVDGANADVFDLVKDKQLTDLDLYDLDHNWTNTEVRNSNAHDPERGYLYPLINYGRLTGRTYAAGNVRYDELYPAVYVRTLLERMLAPYTLTGTLLLDQRFQKLILPFCNDEFRYRESYRAQFDVLNSIDTDMPIPSANTQAFTVLTSNTATVPGSYSLTGDIKYSCVYTGSINALLWVVIDRGSGWVLVEELVLLSGTAMNMHVEASVHNVATGDKIGLLFFPPPLGTNQTVFAGSFTKLALINRVYADQPVHLEANLPDLSQEDLLLTVVNEFNVLIQADPATMTVRMDSLERLRWEKPVDWSRKIDWTTGPAVTFALDNYAQDNIIAYTANEETRESPVSLVDQAVFAAFNAKLEPEKVFYTSPFVPTETLPAFNRVTSLPYIPMWQQEWQSFSLWSAYTTYQPDEWVIWNGQYYKAIAESTSAVPDQQPAKWQLGTEEEVFTRLEPLPRLMVVEERPIGQHVFVGADYNPNTGTGLRTSATFAPISWQELQPTYHSVTGAMLQQTRMLAIRVRLKLPDINALDFLRPVVLNVPARNLQGVFYLNAINQYNPESAGSTEVELVRLYGLPLPDATAGHKEFSHEFSSEFN